MKFYLGIHHPSWLRIVDVPTFVSRNTLSVVKSLPIAKSEWALDSGGFTRLLTHGTWDGLKPRQYVAEVRRFREEIGKLIWAAPQDWMCEPVMLNRTGKTIREHQRLTIENYLELKSIAPELPIVPVLQGFDYDDYLRHVDDYSKIGIDLTACELVGLGSVCRRQNTGMVEALIEELNGMGIRIHGFGFKIQGLRRVSDCLQSSDSMAWSFDARRSNPLPECLHKTCANCLRYALKWREEKILPAIRQGKSVKRYSLFSQNGA